MKRRSESTTVLFDVFYVDGSRSSNRKVALSALEGLDGDAPARGIVEAQDRDIALASGRPRSDVKTIVRTPPREVSDDSGGDRKARGGKK